MKQVVQHYRSGKLSVESVPAPTVQPGCLLVATRASLISVGTERATVGVAKKNLVGKAMDRPDLVRKVINKAQKDGFAETAKMVVSRLDAPVALGYSCAGSVIAVGAGVDGYSVGDRVACAGQNYASHAEFVSVPKNLCVRIPDGVGVEDAAYVTMGAIALQGVRQADPKLGDVVAVIGLGLVGQLTVQLLKANGCRVVASDPESEKRVIARTLGVERAVAPQDLSEAVVALTEGHGADSVIVTASTKDNSPIESAGEITRKKGRVVVVGAVGMNLPREPFYEKELELRLSTSYGPGRYDADYEEKGRDYPYGYVRWTENRNMSAFLGLIAEGRLDMTVLTHHRVPIEHAETAYAKIMETSESPLGVLLTYPEAAVEPDRKVDFRTRVAAEQVQVGLIGAGSHVKDMLVPALKRLKDVEIAAVCTQRGMNAKALGERLGARYCTTDMEELLNDSDINTVVIGTRHDLHAPMVLAALQAGKNVFVEKPLCLNEQELSDIETLYRDKERDGIRLAVGFNRRYSEHFMRAKRFLASRNEPLVMVYRVNAGALPAEHWTQDREVGGGRIVGEACHFVDYLQALCGGPVKTVHANCIAEHGSGIREDQAILSLTFNDGSVGTVVYAAGGDTSLAKERCEVFGDGCSIVMDDFAQSEFFRGGKHTRFKTSGRDKGFHQQMKRFCQSVMQPEIEPMSFDGIASVTRTCFAAVESMKDGEVKRI